MAQNGPKWSCPCGTLNHADWDVCTDCGELRPVISLDPAGAVRRVPRRTRRRLRPGDPITATVGVVLCFISGGLIAFAMHPPAPASVPTAEPAQAVVMNATATTDSAGSGAAWVPAAATPPPVPTFQVATQPGFPAMNFAPTPVRLQYSGQLEGASPPVGLYAPPGEYALPTLQVAPPAPPQPDPGFQPHPSIAQQIVARVRGSLLRIEAEAPAADRRGTGFVVGPRLAVTCAHLVQGTSAITVTLVDGRVLRARVERLDPLNDLALLSTQSDLPAPLPLDPSGRVEPGEPIAVTGFPSGPENPGGTQDFTMPGAAVGWVTRNSPSGERVQMLQVTADVRPGHSGGPVYSLRDGRVLGVMSFRVTSDSVSGFAAGAPMLQQLLGIGAPASAPGVGSTLEAAP